MLRGLIGKHITEEINVLNPQNINASPRSTVAKVTEQPIPRPMQSIPHVNIISDSHLIHSGQNQEDLYNNDTVVQEDLYCRVKIRFSFLLCDCVTFLV